MRVLSATCPCGAVELTLNHAPEFINDCDCSLCLRAGAIWGYYNTAETRITGATTVYVRDDRDTPAVETHSCITCNVTTHWHLTESFKQTTDDPNKMGVNMRLFKVEDKKGVELRFPDGKAWTGEGPYSYRKPAVIFRTRELVRPRVEFKTVRCCYLFPSAFFPNAA